MSRHKQNFTHGFTLIEVLVSGLILFLVLTAMTELYRGAVIGSSKAENSVFMSSAVPFIRANLSHSFRANPPQQGSSGNGKFGEVNYQWKATNEYVGRAPYFLEEDLGRDVEYRLWRIDLSVTYRSSARQFHFNEVTW
jgi:Tfp pilus assembly protein PilV